MGCWKAACIAEKKIIIIVLAFYFISRKYKFEVLKYSVLTMHVVTLYNGTAIVTFDLENAPYFVMFTGKPNRNRL
jgi:hypothetical protein